MKWCISLIVVCAVAGSVGVVIAEGDGDDCSLLGRELSVGVGPGIRSSSERAEEELYRGDMIAEQGIGCSNSTGNWGGPNDWAVGVTATMLPPFGIVDVTYNMFTQNGFVTQLSFMVWSDDSGPGSVIGSQALNPSQFQVGTHTVTISPYVLVHEQALFFGFNQPQTNAGCRIGLDTSSGGSGHSLIRAPACGVAGNFDTVTSVGYPGDWVMRAIINSPVPVELQAYTVE
jgi:hypothetical protein